jgi:hypothetical protein
MPKINNNPIMKGARGMLGGVVVYRQFRGMTIMSNRPRKSKVITQHQQNIKSRFLLAVEYAKKQIADPVLKAKYQPDTGSKFTSAYVAAIADYLRRIKQEEVKMANQVATLQAVAHLATDTDKIDKKTAGIQGGEIWHTPNFIQSSAIVNLYYQVVSIGPESAYFHIESRAGPNLDFSIGKPGDFLLVVGMRE